MAAGPLPAQNGVTDGAPNGAANAAASSAPSERSINPIEDPRDRIYYPGDTERLGPLLRKLSGNIVLDQKEIWTSPFRMKKKDLFWWVSIPAATTALVLTDDESSQVFRNSRGQVTWGNRLSNIGASYTLIPLVAGFYGYGVWRDNPKAREVGVLGAQTLLDSLIVVMILKTATGRNRPESKSEPGEFFEGGASFPSGHTTEMWSFASLLANEYGQKNKTVPIVAYSLASVVSLSRYAAQKHYASDIFLGAAVGYFIGRYVYWTHRNHALHHHGWLRPQILPQFNPAQRSYGVALAFGRTDAR
jgi:membrane-associated phospholipid phosphatase